MTPLRWLTVLLVVATGMVLWPVWPALLLAAWTAALTRPLLVRFERGMHNRRRAAAVLSLLLFVLLALPLGLVVLGVINGGQELLTTIKASPSASSALKAILATPDAPSQLPSTFSDAMALAQRSGAQGFELLTALAGAAAGGLIGLFLYFGGAYALLVDSASAWAWLKRHAPLPEETLERLGRAFHETGRGLLVGVGLTSLTQGIAATIIYLSLGVPRALVLGPITGLASVIPMVGTGLVWAPIALGLLLTDHPVKAAVLTALGLVVISSIDNLLRPVFARWGALNMNMYVLFVAVFGGLAAFGTWGALMGPLVVRLTMEVLALDAREPEALQGPPQRG
jgi:predicted PurR-regulated permease PerM